MNDDHFDELDNDSEQMEGTFTANVEVELEKWAGPVVKGYALQENSWWSADSYLAPIILDALKQYRAAERMGVPMLAFASDEINEDGHFIKGADVRARLRWEEMLDEAIAGFEIISNQFDTEPKDFKAEYERAVHGLQVFAKIFMSLWD